MTKGEKQKVEALVNCTRILLSNLSVYGQMYLMDTIQEYSVSRKDVDEVESAVVELEYMIWKEKHGKK